MKVLLLAGCLACAPFAHALDVSEPKPIVLNSVEFSSIDDQVRTLGTVEFVIDLGAVADDLLELEARRKNLTLKDGRPVTVFGYNKDAGVLIGAVSPVTHISVTGKDQGQVLALFHDDQNRVIAPKESQIQVFDLNYEPLDFSYTPALPPQKLSLDVSVLIDVSGSMIAALPGVTSATRDFMSGLPDYARCAVSTFGTTVAHLTGDTPIPCEKAAHALDSGLTIQGMTALHSAIKESFERHAKSQSELPKLTVVITDGYDTQNPEITVDMLSTLKEQSRSKLIIFWGGAYNPDYLNGLADAESVSGNHSLLDLDRFFRSVGISIDGLQAITIK